MDQAKLLLKEARSYHAVFHQFTLALARATSDTYYLFFEGFDDPAFYIGYIVPRLSGRDYIEFICEGRDNVLGTHRLCARDGRAADRSLFFIDKDLNDILKPSEYVPGPVFQTATYSFENYLVCEAVFRRYWVERLRLSLDDPRYPQDLACFQALHLSFIKRMRLIMAFVLIGHGLGGRTPFKLNLNNVNLDKVLRIDLERRKVRWVKSAKSSFLAAATGIDAVAITNRELRSIFRSELSKATPKQFVRGKFELWFFAKTLGIFTRRLSDKATAKALGARRASPRETISEANALDHLCSLAPCPESLTQYLVGRISAPAAR